MRHLLERFQDIYNDLKDKNEVYEVYEAIYDKYAIGKRFIINLIGKKRIYCLLFSWLFTNFEREVNYII